MHFNQTATRVLGSTVKPVLSGHSWWIAQVHDHAVNAVKQIQ